MSDFQGKVVVITGSSSGIGQAAALFFAKAGASVVLHGQSFERLQETEQLLAAAGVDSAKRVLTVRGSVENDALLREIVDSTLSKFGKIDVLVNNVGIMKLPSAHPYSMENYDYLFNVNLKSVVQLTQLAVPHLEKTKGNIVNLSSVAGKRAFPDNLFYTMTKAALDHYTRNCAVLYASKGIRVNCVSPGPIATRFVSRFGDEIPPEAAKAIREVVIANSIPLGRDGDAAECASVIGFLAGAGATFVTGVVWDVDGGFMASNGFSSLNLTASDPIQK